ncbi:L-aspartate oxidase [Caloramator quimbayensis]|uniref:L-aspartate oxidase n=1 Tax=Caloramator quimbayensis TaxID=1147123 RepID=A0A1T4WK28_9CLOT|nr:L-aspartate oxidase [Caloramator quimbayensis]SKA77680.1 L-aspartate oxidase [Caloramator quimbayensis]
MDIECDVLIVGTGIAGLYSALNLRDDLNIALISKGDITKTNTYLAQGGIATAKDEHDKPSFIEDTLRAGNYKNDLTAVRVLVDESIENIKKLIELGVDFDKSKDNLLYTREGAHSTNRIVHHKDYTGKEVADSLIEKVLKRKNIKIYKNFYLCDLITQNNRCLGGIFIKESKQLNIFSKFTILATGGIGGLFKNSTNQRILTGDGLSIAVKNNIKLKDIQYIQFHPTAFYESTNERRFLISESVRGEGAHLLNSKGERFVDELLPRDEVSSKIYSEMKKTNSSNVYLSLSHLNSSYIKQRFPKIYSECLKRGIDITKDSIPVAPAQHYFMGGIEVDLYSKTSMENLFAAGEVSCSGVHGENRLASNSLLEGLVFSRRAADYINNLSDKTPLKKVSPKIITDFEMVKRENLKIAIDLIKEKRWDLKDELISY